VNKQGPLHRRLLPEALAGLRAAVVPVAEARSRATELGLHRPGLYALHGSAETWQTLDLQDGDGRPLYVGKAEDSLFSRDVRAHFQTGYTGRSTVRRSLAALLRHQLDLTPVTRGSHSRDATDWATKFALELDGDKRLTNWMIEHLTLAAWPLPSSARGMLGELEREAIKSLEPPLCLQQWTGNPWRPIIQLRRAAMAAIVRRGGCERHA
jgi:GIY-YIG catalytic domain-containing protein